jgi:hypothetical protein
MKIDDIFENLSDAKMKSDYYDAFIPVNVVWLDGIVHYLRFEFNDEKSAHRVEEFFNSRFGNMVYYRGDDKVISGIIDTNWKKLKENPTPEQIKEQIKYTNKSLYQLLKRGIIAPEGGHNEETDFWLNQNEKQQYMRRER